MPATSAGIVNSPSVVSLAALVVAAALMSACGLATHALVPSVSLEVWAILHALAALVFVWFGGYGRFETVMKVVIGVMVVTLLGSALVQRPPVAEVLQGLTFPRVPPGSTVLALGVVGGIGGTLTLLSYSYWIREKGWSGAPWAPAMRVDLAVGYGLTGVFGLAVMVLGGAVLLPRGIEVAGREGVLHMAVLLGESFGRPGELVFLVGFWGAVASSLLGVWQGVPYLFQDGLDMLRGRTYTEPQPQRRRAYRGFLLFMTFPPMLLLAWGRPVWVVVVYAALGSFFMPFLAATLLYLNNDRRALGALRNGWRANSMLAMCLALFLYLMVVELGNQLS